MSAGRGYPFYVNGVIPGLVHVGDESVILKVGDMEGGKEVARCLRELAKRVEARAVESGGGDGVVYE